MTQRTNRYFLLTAAAIFAGALTLPVTLAHAQPAPPKPDGTGVRAAARQEITDLLASPAVERIDIRATSLNAANSLIERVADTYLDLATAPLGGVKAAGEYGVAVINGLNDHRVKGVIRILGSATLVVATEQDARDLGTLLALAATSLHRASEGYQGRILLRDSAKNLFDAVIADSEGNTPLLKQYLTQVKELSTSSPARLSRFLVRPLTN